MKLAAILLLSLAATAAGAAAQETAKPALPDPDYCSAAMPIHRNA